jgi:hypothetical protein
VQYWRLVEFGCFFDEKMWTSITNTFKNVYAFLNSGVVPPNTPLELRQEMRKANHFASRKFFIVFSSFLGLCFFYFASVAILFFLPPSGTELISGYVTIFTKTIEVLAIIIAAYLGVQAVVDLKYNSSSNTSTETIKSIGQIDEKVIIEQTTKYAEIYKDDPSYAPIDWALSYDN